MSFIVLGGSRSSMTIGSGGGNNRIVTVTGGVSNGGHFNSTGNMRGGELYE